MQSHVTVVHVALDYNHFASTPRENFRQLFSKENDEIQTCPPKFRLELTILQIVSKRPRERRYTKTGILTLAISYHIV